MKRQRQTIHFFLFILLLALANLAMMPYQPNIVEPTRTELAQATLTNTAQADVRKPTKTPPAKTKLAKPTLTNTAQAAIREPTKTRISTLSAEMQAGNTDWIMAIGIVIVVIIVLPILFKYQEWRRIN